MCGRREKVLTILREIQRICCHPEAAKRPKDPTRNEWPRGDGLPRVIRGVLRAFGPQDDSDRCDIASISRSSAKAWITRPSNSSGGGLRLEKLRRLCLRSVVERAALTSA
jgi:hypothetical protein